MLQNMQLQPFELLRMLCLSGDYCGGNIDLQPNSQECICHAGNMLHQFTGANAGKLNQAMQTYLHDHENPLAGASLFKRQVWNSSIGIK